MAFRDRVLACDLPCSTIVHEHCSGSLLFPLHVLLLELEEIEVVLLSDHANLMLWVVIKEALVVISSAHNLGIYGRVIIKLPLNPHFNGCLLVLLLDELMVLLSVVEIVVRALSRDH